MVLLVGLLVAALTLFSDNAISASALLAVYIIVSLFISVFFVLFRMGRIDNQAPLVLIEAYLVSLTITLLLLLHNIFWPIPFFSITAGIDRGKCIAAVIALLYSLPASIYLAYTSDMFVVMRKERFIRKIRRPVLKSKARLIFKDVRREAAIWSVVNYGILSFLIWVILFVMRDSAASLGAALKGVKFF